MKILFLCSKKYWNHKMSRCRFHSIDAIGRHKDIDLIRDGPGFEGFSSADASERKHKPDLVVWYKPLDIPGYDKVKAPKCIRYNEMYDKKWTSHEIKKSKSGLVICHHFNDIKKYNDKFEGKNYKLIHNPHCAEKTIFKDYDKNKDIDILFTGVVSERFYPLRQKIVGRVRVIMNRKGYNFKKLKHPGYSLDGIKKINNQVKEYAKWMNRSKIVVTCSSKYRYALAKYVEAPMCRTALCADLPDENQDWYKKWIIPISMDYNAEKICERLIDYLNDKDKLKKKTELGYLGNCYHRTQEDYARRFYYIAGQYLDGMMDDYDFSKHSELYLNGGDGCM